MAANGAAYSRAGVDIDAQDRALDQVKDLVRSTFTAEVLSDLGAFGGLFQPNLRGFKEPVLVASADGVGTKLAVAKLAGDYSTVGSDLVNHCVNDILVQGARPLFFLDYVGCSKLEPEAMVSLVRGVVNGCRENGCALLGGETAEMPGFYRPGDYELVGFIVGVVDRPLILDGSRVEHRDLLIGLPSAGLHTNGFSLARKAFFELRGLSLEDRLPSGQASVRDVLLAPHRSYLNEVSGVLGHRGLHGIAHITGGGLTDNLPRVLPEDASVSIRVGAWSIPEEFYCIQEWAGVETDEMFRVFNMGVGMVLLVAPEAASEILSHLRSKGMRACPIGTVQQGGSGVVYDLPQAGPGDGARRDSLG